MSPTSASRSVVSGAGIVANKALTTQTVTVTAKDANGNNRGVGGDNFYIRISNACTNNAVFECVQNGGAEQTIASEIYAIMSHSGSGVYTYSYNVQNDGVLNISVILRNSGTVHAQYYSNIDFTGSTETFYLDNINIDWGSGLVFGKDSDDLSVIFTAYLLPPVSGNYFFEMNFDDGADLIVGGVSDYLRTLNTFN